MVSNVCAVDKNNGEGAVLSSLEHNTMTKCTMLYMDMHHNQRTYLSAIAATASVMPEGGRKQNG